MWGKIVNERVHSAAACDKHKILGGIVELKWGAMETQALLHLYFINLILGYQTNKGLSKKEGEYFLLLIVLEVVPKPLYVFSEHSLEACWINNRFIT